MIIIEKDANNRISSIVLQPNRSISWPLLLRFYLLTCVVSFSIAIAFSVLGYWMVLPFSGLEMMVLGLGLYFTCRNTHRQEVIRVDGEQIRIEKGCVDVEERYEFDRNWVQMRSEERPGWRKSITLSLGSHGEFVEVGSFLNVHEKESLAFELNQSILTDGFFRASN